LETTGDYTFSAVYLQSAEYLASQKDSTVKLYMPTVITADVPAYVKVGTTLTVSGTLKDVLGNPLAGKTVDIWIADPDSSVVIVAEGGETTTSYFSSSPISSIFPISASGITDVSGEYSIEVVISEIGEYKLHAIFMPVGYLRGYVADAPFMVLAEPALAFDVPAEAEQWSYVDISGALIDELLGPVEGALIAIDTGDGKQGEATTGDDGSFLLRHVYMVTGDYTITASYAGSYTGADLLLETETTYAIDIADTNYAIDLGSVKTMDDYLSWIITGLALAVAAYVAFLVIRRKVRSRYALSVAGGATIAINLAIPAPAKSGKNANTSSLYIEFPQAQAPLEDVWGINEELQILLRLFDHNGISLAARTVEVFVDGKMAGAVITDGTGSGIFRYKFAIQSMYNIGCSFAGDDANGPCSESRMIRIVDFREEAVGLFNSIVKSARSKGSKISGKLTPREIERIMVSSFGNMDRKKLDRFMGHAEIALYSSHDFTREGYIDMLGTYKTVFAFIEEA